MYTNLSQFTAALKTPANPTGAQNQRLTTIRDGYVGFATTIFDTIPEGPVREDIVGQLEMTWLRCQHAVLTAEVAHGSGGEVRGACPCRCRLFLFPLSRVRAGRPITPLRLAAGVSSNRRRQADGGP